MSLIDVILADTEKRLEERRRRVPLADIERKAAAADARRASMSFRAALESAPFSIIAEVKKRSPSGGPMDPANVEKALAVYARTKSVSAVSILTDEDHFN